LTGKAKKILVVEDETKIADALRAYLENAGFSVTVAADGEAGLAAFKATLPDLIVLDLMLPKISGEAVCREIRDISRVPIIMLTAKSREDDKLSGFSLGADDYVTKPFSPKELIARVQSILRRCNEGVSPLFNSMSWNDGDLEIEFESHVVKKKGSDVNLTLSEFKILASLVKYPGKAFTRDELIDNAFKSDFDGFERTVDSHVKNLRNKIEDDTANPRYILTVRGVGYKFGITK
jgi:DNA-binding response OmpR family regulator